MGMQYNVTFQNATIKPERFAAMLDREARQGTDDMTPEQLAASALEYVDSLLSYSETANLNPDTSEIELSDCGFYESASYSYGDGLMNLLSYCEPGAYIHEIDAEESSGEQWRHVLHPDGSIKTVYPEITWPGFDADDLPNLRGAVTP